MDWNYRRVGRKYGFSTEKGSGGGLRDFPIEEARLGLILPVIAISLVTYICYGWALQQNSPLAGPLILLFIIGCGLTAATNVLSALLVDLYPMSPATVTAANNLFRCWLGAGATGIIEIMVDHMGRGWCFTFIALVCAAFSPLLVLELKHGSTWREERRSRKDKKRQTSEEKTTEKEIEREWESSQKVKAIGDVKDSEHMEEQFSPESHSDSGRSSPVVKI